MDELLSAGPWHVCEEYKECATPKDANGFFRVSVYCECGRFIRAYMDSV